MASENHSTYIRHDMDIPFTWATRSERAVFVEQRLNDVVDVLLTMGSLHF